MVRIQTISDKLAKRKCAEWLQKNGFEHVELARNSSCDLFATKDDKEYFIEVKYSSKDEGKFFGTVMLTEMFKAINNKNNYSFLICRGKGEDISGWVFKLFAVDEFLRCCTLTTPIFHYHLYPVENNNLLIPNFRENTVVASDKLIKKMWRDFRRWKLKL